MNLISMLRRVALQEDINFLLSNRIPRAQVTRLVGWLSRIEHPWIRDSLLAVWKSFTDLDLSDARKQDFRSLHDCFVRELREGARPIDTTAGVLTSPCDGIVGACGIVQDGIVYQAKGFPYRSEDLFGSWRDAALHEGAHYVTLRLTSSMYHRFHAPASCSIERLVYFSGDTWNVNPIALKRIERLFCKNERVMLQARLRDDAAVITLVAVAAILVASVRLRFLDTPLNLAYRGPNRIECNFALDKGEEIGWFEHGSTILVFAPPGYALAQGICDGQKIRMGQALLVRARNSQASIG